MRSHLLSANGSGRWQFWESAVDAFQATPLLGHGAGSYEAWWAEHGSLAVFVRDAHSLYLETLAELGVLGFLLLVGGVSRSGLVTALSRASAPAGAEGPRSRSTHSRVCRVLRGSRDRLDVGAHGRVGRGLRLSRA